MKQPWFLTALCSAALVVGLSGAGALAVDNIDPNNTNAQFALGENTGWLNAERGGDGGHGVFVEDDGVSGYLWSETTGWVSLSCLNTASCSTSDFWVTNDGSGNLAGYAWSENVGWISFSCTTTNSCGTVDYGVTTSWPTSTQVVGRHVFYNNSAFDALSDDDAIAPDKTALFPGQTASYTSYARGLNGIMVDLDAIATSTLITAADFDFTVGNVADTSTFATAPAPKSINVFPGVGVGGSDRIRIIWPDNAIEKTWLRVLVRANANTGLSQPDVHLWGNALGDACVDATDEILARNNQTSPLADTCLNLIQPS